jgi:parallel beta-helix repeat protein
MLMLRKIAAAALLLAATCLGAQNPVRVASARELVRAIGSDRTVLLAPGEYLLSEVAQVANPAVSWRKTVDGPELVISGLRNLTLRAEQGATLLARPSYGYTLVLVDCLNLSLEGLTLGHTEPGECDGGVLSFERCDGVRIEDCELFGSGVVGLDLRDSSEITVRRSTIRDCTAGALWTVGVENLRLEQVRIWRNESWPLISIDASKGVVLDSCRIEGNLGGELIGIDSYSERVVLSNCLITDNEAPSLLFEESQSPDFYQTVIADNRFADEAEEQEEDYGEYDE